LQRAPLSPLGVRKEFQQALAELRTDLDVFSPEESGALMACGYQMASKALDRQLPHLRDVWTGLSLTDWPFKDMLEEIRFGREHDGGPQTTPGCRDCRKQRRLPGRLAQLDGKSL